MRRRRRHHHQRSAGAIHRATRGIWCSRRRSRPRPTLLWDTRHQAPALKLAPDAGDRTLVRKGDASVLGNAMAMRLWLPQAQPSSKPPLALVGHENGRILAWDLAMPVPQICAKTPQNAFKSPNVALGRQ